jgi:acetate kinase
MKILSINAGSSSLKFTLYDFPEKKELINGYFEKIGLDGSFYTIKKDGNKDKKEVVFKTHSEAVKILVDELINYGVIKSLDEIEGVGHRIVQGADKFDKSVIIDDKVIETIDELSALAPLHNPAHIVGIKAFQEYLPNVPMVAVFDTAYHQTMPKDSYLYPVPMEWYENYGVRKYGAHGTSHRFVYNELCNYLKKDNLKVVSCHIGSGASVTAIDSGKVLDTSMGFTPLAGVMMGTRCGDIDVSMIPYVMKHTGKNIDEILTDLNKNSGLLAISGLSSDNRDIEIAAAEGNERCALAQKMYSRRVADFIAKYNNLLNGADAIILTAGLGENAAIMRGLILEKIASLGVKLDSSKNDFRGEFRLITTDDSKIPVYVIPTNEELLIASDTYELINK